MQNGVTIFVPENDVYSSVLTTGMADSSASGTGVQNHCVEIHFDASNSNSISSSCL